ncbi:MAG: hypothetical protein LLG97_16855 [Deltaproteobacteria bacterium]|nr:hypothetical protein [Deltaproteobacteria bacterium]
MNVMLKRILIAAGLFAFCVAVLAGVKLYGVWVISGIAVLLVIVGLLRREKPSEPNGPDGIDKRDGEG